MHPIQKSTSQQKHRWSTSITNKYILVVDYNVIEAKQMAKLTQRAKEIRGEYFLNTTNPIIPENEEELSQMNALCQFIADLEAGVN
jgi:hypothetical protein